MSTNFTTWAAGNSVESEGAERTASPHDCQFCGQGDIGLAGGYSGQSPAMRCFQGYLFPMRTTLGAVAERTEILALKDRFLAD